MKSDNSTKPSTVNEEKEPIPSFLKALSYIQTDIHELEEDILDQTFSNPSLVATEKSS